MPKRLICNKIGIFEKAILTEIFNKFFVNIGPNLANKIPESNLSFKPYLQNFDCIMPESDLTMIELNNAFFSLKTNKSAGLDDISVNVVKKVYGNIQLPLYHIFKLSLKVQNHFQTSFLKHKPTESLL